MVKVRVLGITFISHNWFDRNIVPEKPKKNVDPRKLSGKITSYNHSGSNPNLTSELYCK